MKQLIKEILLRAYSYEVASNCLNLVTLKARKYPNECIEVK